ncbi:MAG: superoxide dismutase [Lentisphaerae bacterium]|nr:superoxide dismutase [Lentisphaerota bacterium]
MEPLPYGYDALEPHIDAKTMEIHYARHHRAYFNNLVKAAAGTEVEGATLEAIFGKVSKLPLAVRNNAGGHYNHTLFWRCMSAQGGGVPTGSLGEAIDKEFGSFERFRELFTEAALSRFGSGWAWLSMDAKGELFIVSTANQDNTLMDTAERWGFPLLGVDVWEHAYYLKYQNMRGSYMEAFWKVVNWSEVSTRFIKALADVKQ